jgi:hypothetical protein
LSSGLGGWLLLQEEDGWKIRWPIADGKMEDIKKACIDRSIQPRGIDKPKKEDWALVLGRSQAVSHLLMEFS